MNNSHTVTGGPLGESLRCFFAARYGHFLGLVVLGAFVTGFLVGVVVCLFGPWRRSERVQDVNCAKCLLGAAIAWSLGVILTGASYVEA